MFFILDVEDFQNDGIPDEHLLVFLPDADQATVFSQKFARLGADFFPGRKYHLAGLGINDIGSESAFIIADILNASKNVEFFIHLVPPDVRKVISASVEQTVAQVISRAFRRRFLAGTHSFVKLLQGVVGTERFVFIESVPDILAVAVKLDNLAVGIKAQSAQKRRQRYFL